VVGWRYAQWQRKREEAATREQEQDAALNAYLGQMSNLMVDQQLGKEAKNKDFLQDQVRKVAQARTIAVLLERVMNSIRNGLGMRETEIVK
jgi:hypothetical protein